MVPARPGPPAARRPPLLKGSGEGRALISFRFASTAFVFRFFPCPMSAPACRKFNLEPKDKQTEKIPPPAASVLRGYLQRAQCRAAAPTPWVTRTRTLGCRDVPSRKHHQLMLSTWGAPQPPQQLSAVPAQPRICILLLHSLVLLYIEGAVHRELC